MCNNFYNKVANFSFFHKFTCFLEIWRHREQLLHWECTNNQLKAKLSNVTRLTHKSRKMPVCPGNIWILFVALIIIISKSKNLIFVKIVKQWDTTPVCSTMDWQDYVMLVVGDDDTNKSFFFRQSCILTCFICVLWTCSSIVFFCSFPNSWQHMHLSCSYGYYCWLCHHSNEIRYFFTNELCCSANFSKLAKRPKIPDSIYCDWGNFEREPLCLLYYIRIPYLVKVVCTLLQTGCVQILYQHSMTDLITHYETFLSIAYLAVLWNLAKAFCVVPELA